MDVEAQHHIVLVQKEDLVLGDEAGVSDGGLIQVVYPIVELVLLLLRLDHLLDLLFKFLHHVDILDRLKVLQLLLIVLHRILIVVVELELAAVIFCKEQIEVGRVNQDEVSIQGLADSFELA